MVDKFNKWVTNNKYDNLKVTKSFEFMESKFDQIYIHSNLNRE